jgi:hypothetical protein
MLYFLLAGDDSANHTQGQNESFYPSNMTQQQFLQFIYTLEQDFGDNSRYEYHTTLIHCNCLLGFRLPLASSSFLFIFYTFFIVFGVFGNLAILVAFLTKTVGAKTVHIRFISNIP